VHFGNPIANKCFKIIQSLKKHTASTPFLQPVDAVKLKIPDYYQIVKEPMDLATVEKRLRKKKYQTTQ
jgi:hypothetical protein